MQHVLGIDDLADADIDGVFALANRHRTAGRRPRIEGAGRVVGLIFLESSLRTRVGFAAAAGRLGWTAVDVAERRSSAPGIAERWQDTARVVAGYCDVAVIRAPVPLTGPDLASLPVPVVNAGDRGQWAEHPTQGLIDYFAMECILGQVGGLHVAVCGDLGMRAARSLLALLGRRPPRLLSLLHPTSLHRPSLPAALRDRVRFGNDLRSLADEPPDVVHVMGIPHASVPERERAQLRLDARVLALLPTTLVFSPMPVIDEIASPVREDPQVVMMAQSDLGLFVRMAVLELAWSRAR